MNARNVLAILNLSALLAACSGGSTNTVTVPAPDTTPPLVLATTPASGGTGIATNASVQAVFSETMKLASLTTANVTLSASGTSVSGTLTVSGDQRNASFAPSSALAPNTVYTATITTGAQDAAGNGLAADYSWSFTTGAAPDTTAPAVTATNPPSNATGVGLASALAVTFSEPMNCATLSASSFALAPSAGGALFAGTVSCSGATAVFTPLASLSPGTQYTASLSGATQDPAGNGLASTYAWSFTTGAAPDVTPPTVSSTSPAGNASGVATNSAVNVAFSEAMNCSTLNTSTFTLVATSGGAPVVGGVNCSGATASFIAATGLATNTQYTATVTSSAQDLAGNRLAGSVAWNFTTAAAPDVTPPVLLSVTPASGAVNQQASSIAISATFNEPIDCATVSSSSFYVMEAGVAVLGYTQCSGATVTFRSLSGTSLPTNTKLMASLTPGIKDLAGNSIASYSWSFAMAPWTRQWGTAMGDYAYAIASDAAGNVYVAGNTNGALDGQTSAGGYDIFVTKHDASGVRQWTRQLGTAGYESAWGITSDAAGNVYVAGSTAGALDGQTSAGGTDLFVTKYDTNGVKQWTRQLGTAGTEVATAITSDAAGNVYAAGYTDGALDGQTSASPGLTDFFVTKYDTNGVKQWTRQLGTAGSDYAAAITSDTAGNVYVAGQTNGALDGQTSAGGYDLFVTKYDSNGNKQWTRQLGTAGADAANAIASDEPGNVYVAGTTGGALDGQTSAGGNDLFVTKYDINGVKQWTRQLGTAANEIANAITSDAAGNVYVTGYTTGSLDGQTSAGGYDLFVTKYDTNGIKQWTRQLGTAGYDSASATTSDTAGNVYVAGNTDSALDGQTSAGGYDPFIVKYQFDGRKR